MWSSVCPNINFIGPQWYVYNLYYSIQNIVAVGQFKKISLKSRFKYCYQGAFKYCAGSEFQMAGAE